MTDREAVLRILAGATRANDNGADGAPSYTFNFFGPVTINIAGGAEEPSLSGQNLVSPAERRARLSAVPPLRKAK